VQAYKTLQLGPGSKAMRVNTVYIRVGPINRNRNRDYKKLSTSKSLKIIDKKSAIDIGKNNRRRLVNSAACSGATFSVAVAVAPLVLHVSIAIFSSGATF
jgi:hypothetical protein